MKVREFCVGKQILKIIEKHLKLNSIWSKALSIEFLLVINLTVGGNLAVIWLGKLVLLLPFLLVSKYFLPAKK